MYVQYIHKQGLKFLYVCGYKNSNANYWVDLIIVCA